MKKQILAVAVAGAFAVPAFAAADTNVTLFGQLQTQVVHASNNISGLDSSFNQTDAGGVADYGFALTEDLDDEAEAVFGALNLPGALGDGSGPSRIGVMVNHDLGNGLTALLKMESNATTQDAFRGARDNYVGLDGNFGRVIAGRTGGSYSTAGKDPLNATFMQARANGARLGGLNGFGNGSYLARSIRYMNDFGLVNLDVAVAIDNGDDSDTGVTGRLNFDLSPVDLYIAHSDFGGYGGSVFDTQRATKVGVDWNSGPFRVVAEVEDYKFSDIEGSPGIESSGNTFFVSGTYSMGRNDFVLNLGQTRRDSVMGESLPNTDYAAIAVKHNFSNRVMAFAGVGYNSTDAGVGYNSTDDFGYDFTPEGDVVGTGSSLSFTGVGGGMRVSF